jgi:HD superfamily phosphodiesterase
MDEASLLQDMEQYFGKDIKRINHAKRVTEFAKKLLVSENGDAKVVIPAAIFHDIGIHEAERKFGSSAGHYQEIEGPSIAREILKKYLLAEPVLEEILAIIGNHHSPGKIDTTNFKIVYDADWLVNLPDEYKIEDKEKMRKIISKVFLTASGKELARKMYLEESK